MRCGKQLERSRSVRQRAKRAVSVSPRMSFCDEKTVPSSRRASSYGHDAGMLELGREARLAQEPSPRGRPRGVRERRRGQLLQCDFTTHEFIDRAPHHRLPAAPHLFEARVLTLALEGDPPGFVRQRRRDAAGRGLGWRRLCLCFRPRVPGRQSGCADVAIPHAISPDQPGRYADASRR